MSETKFGETVVDSTYQTILPLVATLALPLVATLVRSDRKSFGDLVRSHVNASGCVLMQVRGYEGQCHGNGRREPGGDGPTGASCGRRELDSRRPPA